MKNRKFLLVLPLLVTPFLLLLFWSLGGGKGNDAEKEIPVTGFNTDLPAAQLKETREMDKMSYYDKAAEDSGKLLSRQKQENYLSFNAEEDSNESKIYRQLEALNKVVTAPTTPVRRQTSFDDEPAQRIVTHEPLPVQASIPDTELQQLDGMLEKILDIQQGSVTPSEPQAVAQPDSNAYGITLRQSVPVSQFGVPVNKLASGGFYTAYCDTTTAHPGIEATVIQEGTVSNGSTVKLQLLQDIVINGRQLTRGQYIYGVAALQQERLLIAIRSIRCGNELLPVKIEVYDVDGIAGIHIPGSMSGEAAKQVTDRAMQALTLGSLNPSLGAQAAGAGIETAKNLLSKKVRVVKVRVKPGYRVLLYNLGQL